MAAERFLIVNADDFGLSTGTNQGIIAAHEQGTVTSASLMVRQPAAAEAAVYGKTRSKLSVGLHLDFGEWVWREGGWVEAYYVVDVEDPNAVRAEVVEQLRVFRELLGGDPTHMDSHQHVHRNEPARSVVLEVAAGLGIPVRHCTEEVVFCGDFYGQGARNLPFPEGVTAANLLEIIARLPPGISELGCHPGLDPELASSYRAERVLEVQTLCDPCVRAAVANSGIELITYADWRGAVRG